MFKTRTSNLDDEEDNKKYEKLGLFDFEGCRRMRCIVIPVLIGFALFLVFMSVKVTADLNQSTAENTTNTTRSTANSSYPTTNELKELDATAKNMPSADTTTKNSVHLESSSQYSQQMLLRSGHCLPVSDKDFCNIECFGGWFEDLPRELEDMQKRCGMDGYLKIVVRSYAIVGFILKAQHLSGNFHAEYLKFDSITGNSITQIEAGAFDIDSMASLKTLIFEGLNTPLLNEETFHGLSLENFDMTIQAKNFIGSGFLQPFAKSLKQLKLRQTQTQTIFDPTNWLQGAHFPLLWQLDLSNNNFGNTLRRETFEMMDAIREIYLMKCQISRIADGTFDAVAKTLKILDLSNNQLTTLDANFLTNIDGTFKLELQGNEWNCTCENDQLINFLSNSEISYADKPVCSTPEDWKDQPLDDKSIMLNCVRETTTIIDKSSTPFKITKPPAVTTTLLPAFTTSAGPTGTSSSLATSSITLPKPPLKTTTQTLTTTDPTLNSPSTAPSPDTIRPTWPSTTLQPSSTTFFSTTTDMKRTTPNPDQHLSLYCSSISAHSSEEDNSVTVRDYDAYFSIQTQSQHSVTLFIKSTMDDLHLIYFLPKNRIYFNVTNNATTSSIESRTTQINIFGLLSQQLYVFCLIPKDDLKISPFNCLSYFSEMLQMAKSDWLSKDDLAWVITVFVIILILTLCCGLIAIYFVLRCRPTWICGSRRIIRKGSKSRKVYLVPKRREMNENAESSDAHGNLDFKSYDYMRSYKDLTKCQQNQVQIQMPPHESASSILSSNQSRTSPAPMSIRTDEIIELIDDDGNEKEGMNYFRKLNIYS